jgi:dihydrodipicolinate synthase/N-acetylneuraminate lyase
MSFLAYGFGSEGVVSGSAAVFPKHEVELYHLCMAKKWKEAADLFYGHILPLLNYCLNDPYGPAACKTVLQWQGVVSDPRPRPPFKPINETRRNQLRRAVEWAGLL